MSYPEILQSNVGAAMAPNADNLLRTSLEEAIIRGYNELNPRHRDRLLRHRGALAQELGVEVLKVTPLDGTTNMRYFVRKPGKKRIVRVPGIVPVDFNFTGGTILGDCTVAEGRLLQGPGRCQLVFAGPNDQVYLIVPSNFRVTRQPPSRLPARIQGPPLTVKYRRRYGGKDPVGLAFKAVNRADFMPEGKRELAKLDRFVLYNPLASISQPSLVAYTLRLLGIQPGDRVLEVGSGGGFVLALASQLAGSTGRVVGCEVQEGLIGMARTNIAPYELAHVALRQANPGWVLGAPDLGPFDCIIVSCGADCVPVELLEQLAPGGRLVVPVGSVLAVVTKTADGQLIEQLDTKLGVGFVPLL